MAAAERQSIFLVNSDEDGHDDVRKTGNIGSTVVKSVHTGGPHRHGNATAQSHMWLRVE
jgi:hypothetical protein